MISKPPGIEDIFPDRIEKWNRIVDAARSSFVSFNYRECIIPIMEFAEVFTRGLGGATDIVTKEMFTLEDRGGRNLALRPEGTASLVRAYVENGEFNRLSTCKFFYHGPMFRAERPQKGRLRQFNQFGAEMFGSIDPYYDFEIILVMDTIARKLGIMDYTLLLNSIGCPECRGGYIKVLSEYYLEKSESLCDDCKTRLNKNPLRLLDCKKEKCRPLKEEAPFIRDYICEGCSTHHEKLQKLLDDNNVRNTDAPRLVRGLDYYTRTTFEFVTDRLGGQNAFAAGGRYDNLVEQSGGKSTPAVGFAAGIERLFLLMDGAVNSAGIDFYLVHSGGESLNAAIKLIPPLTSRGFSMDIDPEKTSFKQQMKKANKENARLVLIIGEDELMEKKFTVKEMSSGSQASYGLDTFDEYLKGVHVSARRHEGRS